MKELLEQPLFHIGTYTFTAAMLVGLALVWLLTSVLLRALHRAIHRGARLLNVSDAGRRHSLFLIAQYLVWTLAAVLMLEIVGVHVSVVLAGSAALLVGVGLGVQQIFRDIASGIFLLFEGTIEVGDVLEVDGKVGRVQEISLRTSQLVTRDGITMIVPNHKFITENLTNWTRTENQPVAFHISVRVACEADERLMAQILQTCADQQPGIVHDQPAHAPQVRLAEIEEKCAHYQIKFWTLEKFEVDALQSELRFRVQQQLRENEVPLFSKDA